MVGIARLPAADKARLGSHEAEMGFIAPAVCVRGGQEHFCRFSPKRAPAHLEQAAELMSRATKAKFRSEVGFVGGHRSATAEELALYCRDESQSGLRQRHCLWVFGSIGV